MHSENDGRHDFDFFIGRWKGHNRRLRERLKGSHEWQEFEGTSVARKILGGLGNVDEVRFHRGTGYPQGFTLRLFDPKSQEWSIYWASSLGGALEIPMIGKFLNGIGEFMPMKSSKIGTSSAASFGVISPQIPVIGSKLSPSTVARTGRQIGPRTLPG